VLLLVRACASVLRVITHSRKNYLSMCNPMREIAANHEAYKLLVISHVRSTHPRKHSDKISQAQIISLHFITAKFKSRMDVESEMNPEIVSNWKLLMFQGHWQCCLTLKWCQLNAFMEHHATTGARCDTTTSDYAPRSTDAGSLILGAR